MLEKNKQRAFTLMEMLVVIIILGILLAIAIPSVTNLMNQNRNKMYRFHMNIVEEKTELYMDHHRGILNNGATCYQIDYQTLVNQEGIIEKDVHCTGTIYMKKDASSGIFTPMYDLNCEDSKHNSFKREEETYPSGCTSIH